MNSSGYDDKNLFKSPDHELDTSDLNISEKEHDKGLSSGKRDMKAIFEQYIGEVKDTINKLRTKKNDQTDLQEKPTETPNKNSRPTLSVGQIMSSNAKSRKDNINSVSTVVNVPPDGKTNVLYAKRTLKTWLISLLIIVVFMQLSFFSVNQLFFAPPSWDGTKIEFEVVKGASFSDVAESLQKNGFIKNALVFRIYAQFSDKAYKLKSGVYELSKNMSITDILDTITRGEGYRTVIKLTIVEGKNVETMASQIKSAGIVDNTKTFYDLANNLDYYKSKFSFLNDIPTDSQRRYALEGYLFPDTYEVYSDVSADSVIQKQLTRFRTIYTTEYEQRAKSLGMTMDQVITLASIIEKEAKTDDFKKVSAVFHNRLKNGMALQSCATVQYAKGIKRLDLTDEDIAYDSPYNTYLHKGLPIGPICSPGKKAIEAALYPDDTYVKQGYLYFCVSDPATGATVFSKTYEEHMTNVNKYKPLWQEYDKNNQ